MAELSNKTVVDPEGNVVGTSGKTEEVTDPGSKEEGPKQEAQEQEPAPEEKKPEKESRLKQVTDRLKSGMASLMQSDEGDQSADGGEADTSSGTTTSEGGTDEPRYTVGGKDYTESELTALIQKSENADNAVAESTRRNQEAAKIRRLMERAKQVQGRLKDSAFADEIRAQFQEEFGAEAAAELDTFLETDLADLEHPDAQPSDELRQDAAAREALDTLMKTEGEPLKKKFNLSDDQLDKVLKHAVEMYDRDGSVVPLETAFKDMDWDTQFRKAQEKEKPAPPPKQPKKTTGARDFGAAVGNGSLSGVTSRVMKGRKYKLTRDI